MSSLMYRYLIFFFIGVSSVYGETLKNPSKLNTTNIQAESLSNHSTNLIEEKKTLTEKLHKYKIYDPILHPYLSFFTILGGSSSLLGGGSPNNTVPTSTWILSGRIPVYKDNFYLYLQLRASFFLGKSSFPLSTVLPIIQMENAKIGTLIGVGGIVADWRTEGVGWHIAINGGLVLEGGVSNNFISFSDIPNGKIYQFFAFGPEINIMTHYSIHRYFSLNIGFHLGYRLNPFSGDPFYQDKTTNSTYFHTMNYGISFGIAF